MFDCELQYLDGVASDGIPEVRSQALVDHNFGVKCGVTKANLIDIAQESITVLTPYLCPASAKS